MTDQTRAMEASAAGNAGMLGFHQHDFSSFWQAKRGNSHIKQRTANNMKSNVDISNADWIDYFGMTLVIVGIFGVGLLSAIKYGWACVCGRGEAWR
jgi:hypothetical protein